ncbi:hypothetical protein PVAP13_5KG003100 [Panicum virgatum]|uniref:Uncharacterized protein n=1 Tax=Panicum virgatum TaxID=38727 RepID=A0A8T0S7H3_PANVG|nr:hypothetical protein PVAP13_5KG003100 [Panicum virgatum]
MVEFRASVPSILHEASILLPWSVPLNSIEGVRRHIYLTICNSISSMA